MHAEQGHWPSSSSTSAAVAVVEEEEAALRMVPVAGCRTEAKAASKDGCDDKGRFKSDFIGCDVAGVEGARTTI